MRVLMLLIGSLFCIVLAAAAASAEQSDQPAQMPAAAAPAPQPPATVTAFNLSIQQVITSYRIMLEDMERQLQAREEKIADMEKRCPSAPK